MKLAVRSASIAEGVLKFSKQMGGVFSVSDLSVIISGGSKLRNQRMIAGLVSAGIISRAQKGLYVTKDCDLAVLSARISGNSYISMDSALAIHQLTGSVPQRTLSVVHVGKKMTVTTPLGSVNFYSISPSLFFGFSSMAPGIKLAEPEKAYIDMLYFYTKGASFLIDPLNDVNTKMLDKKKVLEYLRRYKNPKFVKFVKGTL